MPHPKQIKRIKSASVTKPQACYVMKCTAIKTQEGEIFIGSNNSETISYAFEKLSEFISCDTDIIQDVAIFHQNVVTIIEE